jgi:diguanylate cyclase (GGDEF)-like protein
MGRPATGVGSKEQRRFARQAASQAVRICFADGAAIPSEIRDFCQTGLYVAFLGKGAPDGAIPALVSSTVQVEFGRVGTSGGQKFSGRVMHVSASGMGVFVAAMPEWALQALRKSSRQVDRPATAQLPSGLGSQQTQALRQECTSLFRSFLDAVMQEFFQGAEDRLVEAGRDELSFLERSRYEYGAQELVQHRNRIEDEFFNAIRDRIQNARPVAETSGGVGAKDTLALVDEAEFEDWLNLSTVVKQIEAEIVLQLDEFEPRYSRLAGMPIDRKNNPFGPEVICRTFQVAIQALDFSNPMRSVLYKTLGQAVSRHGPELYRQLNQALASLQTIEHAKPAADKAPAKPVPAAPAPAEADESGRPQADLAELADTLNQLYEADRAGTMQTPESADSSLDRILTGMNLARQRPPGGASPLPAAHTHRQSGLLPETAERPTVLQVVDRLQQAAHQLVGHNGPRQQATGTSRVGETVLPDISLPELLKALDGLPLADQAAPGQPQLPSFSELVDERIASIEGGAGQLNSNHRQILDATTGLFARARSDFVPSSDLESLVKRLERPLLKLALQDTNFPNSPQHPARQVLNLIEQYAVAADDKGKFLDARLQRFLYLLVDRVCSRADRDPGIFEQVRDHLGKVLLPILQIRRARVARLQEASEGKERIRSARARVNRALEQRLAGRKVPAMLLRLLDAGWRQYLVLLELRQGTQGDVWDAGLGVLDRLSALLDPAYADAPRTETAVQQLLSEIERTLSTVAVDTNLLSAFMDDLGDSLAIHPSSPTMDPAMVLVPPGKLARPNGEGSEAPTVHRQLVDRLRVGEWWNYSMEGSVVPMQLIWISQPASTCTFANRSATNKLELTLAELSKKIRNDLAKPGKDLDLPLIERSEYALFDETYQNLIHQVMHDPLTGLLNRKGFMQRLNQLALPDHKGMKHALGIIEFDQFRMIYNTCGVEAVERLARTLASKVQAIVGPDAALASFRDDTLALLLPDCSREKGCEAVDKLLSHVKDFHFEHEQNSYSIGLNIGITEYAPDQTNTAEAIRHADSACLTAKSQGRNRMQVYEQSSPQLQTQESLMDLAGRIDSFLNGSGLHLRCQQVMPIGADTSLLPYYEILLGIEGEDGIEINPMKFIPAVESLQRAHEVDIWVVQKVFEWIKANPSYFASVGGFAINLSATSLSNPEVMAYLQQALLSSKFPTSKITFEITETAAIQSYGAAQDFIREIRRFGCKFSLDDFGSGFTSYAHLKNLLTDALKIDGSFIKDMLENPGDYAMVKSMNDIGHSLGLLTVAEYVESPMILEALREIGVDYAQGYAIHKPYRIDELLSEKVH